MSSGRQGPRGVLSRPPSYNHRRQLLEDPRDLPYQHHQMCGTIGCFGYNVSKTYLPQFGQWRWLCSECIEENTGGGQNGSRDREGKKKRKQKNLEAAALTTGVDPRRALPNVRPLMSFFPSPFTRFRWERNPLPEPPNYLLDLEQGGGEQFRGAIVELLRTCFEKIAPLLRWRWVDKIGTWTFLTRPSELPIMFKTIMELVTSKNGRLQPPVSDDEMFTTEEVHNLILNGQASPKWPERPKELLDGNNNITTVSIGLEALREVLTLLPVLIRCARLPCLCQPTTLTHHPRTPGPDDLILIRIRDSFLWNDFSNCLTPKWREKTLLPMSWSHSLTQILFSYTMTRSLPLPREELAIPKHVLAEMDAEVGTQLKKSEGQRGQEEEGEHHQIPNGLQDRMEESHYIIPAECPIPEETSYYRETICWTFGRKAAADVVQLLEGCPLQVSGDDSHTKPLLSRTSSTTGGGAMDTAKHNLFFIFDRFPWLYLPRGHPLCEIPPDVNTQGQEAGGVLGKTSTGGHDFRTASFGAGACLDGHKGSSKWIKWEGFATDSNPCLFESSYPIQGKFLIIAMRRYFLQTCFCTASSFSLPNTSERASAWKKLIRESRSPKAEQQESNKTTRDSEAGQSLGNRLDAFLHYQLLQTLRDALTSPAQCVNYFRRKVPPAQSSRNGSTKSSDADSNNSSSRASTLPISNDIEERLLLACHVLASSLLWDWSWDMHTVAEGGCLDPRLDGPLEKLNEMFLDEDAKFHFYAAWDTESHEQGDGNRRDFLSSSESAVEYLRFGHQTLQRLGEITAEKIPEAWEDFLAARMSPVTSSEEDDDDDGKGTKKRVRRPERGLLLEWVMKRREQVRAILEEMREKLGKTERLKKELKEKVHSVDHPVEGSLFRSKKCISYCLNQIIRLKNTSKRWGTGNKGPLSSGNWALSMLYSAFRHKVSMDRVILTLYFKTARAQLKRSMDEKGDCTEENNSCCKKYAMGKLSHDPMTHVFSYLWGTKIGSTRNFIANLKL